MEEVRMWTIMRRFCYRYKYVVMEAKSGYYLIDTDKPTFWLGYFLPIFNWLIPHTVMKINLSAEEINDLLLNKSVQEERERAKSGAIWIGIALGTVILPRILGSTLTPLFNEMHSELSTFEIYLVLLVLLGLLLLLKIYVVKKGYEVLEIIGEENLSETKIMLKPETTGQGLRLAALFGLYLLFCLFWIIAFSISTPNHWGILLLGLLSLSIFLFVNCILILNGKYKVKFLDQL